MDAPGRALLWQPPQNLTLNPSILSQLWIPCQWHFCRALILGHVGFVSSRCTRAASILSVLLCLRNLVGDQSPKLYDLHVRPIDIKFAQCASWLLSKFTSLLWTLRSVFGISHRKNIILALYPQDVLCSFWPSLHP
jgi:hypothetical protein